MSTATARKRKKKVPKKKSKIAKLIMDEGLPKATLVRLASEAKGLLDQSHTAEQLAIKAQSQADQCEAEAKKCGCEAALAYWDAGQKLSQIQNSLKHGQWKLFLEKEGIDYKRGNRAINLYQKGNRDVIKANKLNLDDCKKKWNFDLSSVATAEQKARKQQARREKSAKEKAAREKAAAAAAAAIAEGRGDDDYEPDTDKLTEGLVGVADTLTKLQKLPVNNPQLVNELAREIVELAVSFISSKGDEAHTALGKISKESNGLPPGLEVPASVRRKPR